MTTIYIVCSYLEANILAALNVAFYSLPAEAEVKEHNNDSEVSTGTKSITSQECSKLFTLTITRNKTHSGFFKNKLIDVVWRPYLVTW